MNQTDTDKLTSSLVEEGRSVSVPDWYPGWAREMANLYFAANTCLFVIHGNVNDLIHCEVEEKGKTVNRFCGLTDFLSQQVFGTWDVVASYDMGRGIQAQAGPNPQRLRDMMKTLSEQIGSCLLYTSPSPRD